MKVFSLKISSQVKSPWRKVQRGFDESLFLRLNPPFPKAQLHRFDGCEKGDEVHLSLHFGFFTQSWVSKITENGQDEQGFYFVDEGLQLPFFLKSWKHRHIIHKSEQGSLITDHISYSTSSILLSLLLYPALYLQFLYRKPVYKRIFQPD